MNSWFYDAEYNYDGHHDNWWETLDLTAPSLTTSICLPQQMGNMYLNVSICYNNYNICFIRIYIALNSIHDHHRNSEHNDVSSIILFSLMFFSSTTYFTHIFTNIIEASHIIPSHFVHRPHSSLALHTPAAHTPYTHSPHSTAIFWSSSNP